MSRTLVCLYLKLILLAAVVGTLTRVVLLFSPQTTDLGFAFGEWLEVFALGALNDVCAMTLGFVFMMVFVTSVSARKYRAPFGFILLGLLIVATLYILCFNTIFDEYGGVVPAIAAGIMGYWTASFALRLSFERVRPVWTLAWLAVLILIYVGAVILNAACEVVFWSEFGVRYNFIAVDYLVYTNEVVGNIVESYPIGWWMLCLVVVTLTVAWVVFHYELGRSVPDDGPLYAKIGAWAVYGVMAVAAFGIMRFNTRFQDSENVYVNELQANGAYKFCEAFVKNELDYKQFYLTLPDDEAAAIVHAEYGSSGDSNFRRVTNDRPEEHPNIVLVTLESMSASFLERFGGTDGLTPNLDSLCRKGLSFDHVYATGNRTVRGLEAVSLSLPPCPGQSLIKRRDNGGLFTTASVLRAKGYSATFFYGGNAYFDNMEAFFGGNDYEIVDKKVYAPDEITFANIWGVCDEDAYRKAIAVLGEKAASGTPFFAHIMSVSNHRPYTYPAGRISIPNDSKSRSGGVMYSDYALGEFIAQAEKQPWFDNTVFLITADHCASSAGKTEIPLGRYRIPAVIYAPSRIAPETVGKIASQIDLVPTLLALLGMDYDTGFYGRNILADDFRERAFIATYENLGYLDGEVFTVLSPVCRVSQYRVVPTEQDPYHVEPLAEPDTENLHRAIGFYQTAGDWGTIRRE